ncbi:TNF receptor-associated factor 6 isoform X1 [Ixodes scapularis]|uniref:TNF receptor-associated factor 6 isoform X1 n=1 Tax=Ixodes scapularis TaxID=6945 RepID=UPI001C385E84|nr:TNF receptor-associated factor 6 isoform X1 [Ixodes scapularis]
MPRKVPYRDFPGGPIGIEFSDELPHWNLCGICGMLSAFMSRDELGHIFCKVCVDAHHQNKRIFCKHENRFVELADLYAAVEVIQFTHDLTVFCPYKKLGCTEYRPLRFMKKHLVECPMTTVTRCKACDALLPIKDHPDHKALCPEAHVLCNTCVRGMPRRKYKDHRNQCQRRPEPSHQEENPTSINVALQEVESRPGHEACTGQRTPVHCRGDQTGRAIEDNTAIQQAFLQEAWEEILNLQERIAEMEQRKREDDQSRSCLEVCIADQDKLLQDYMEKNKKLEQKIREMENRQREDDHSRLKMQDHIAEQEKLLQDVLEENLKLQEKPTGLEDQVDMANEVAQRSREPAIQPMGHDLSNRIKTYFNYVTKSVRGLPEEDFR